MISKGNLETRKSCKCLGSTLAVSFLCLVNVLYGAVPPEPDTFPIDQNTQEISIAPKQYKEVEVQIGEDDPNRFHAIEVYGEREGGCVFAAVVAAMKLAKYRGEPLIIVTDGEINSFRDAYVDKLEKLLGLSRKFIQSIDCNEKGMLTIQYSSLDLESLSEEDQILLRHFFRAWGANLLEDIPMKGLKIDKNDFVELSFVQDKMREARSLEEALELRENLPCNKEGLTFALKQLGSFMAGLCQKAKIKKTNETYCAQEWYKFTKEAIDDIRNREGINSYGRVFLGMLQDPHGKNGELFCDNYTLNVYHEITNGVKGGSCSENPVSGDVYIELPKDCRFFYKKECPKIELNVLSCTVGDFKIIEGKKQWDLVGHMMPLVRREDSCIIFYKNEDMDVAAQSFPVIVKSKKEPYGSKYGSKTDEKAKYRDIVLLQMKIGTSGLPDCEKFSIAPVCKDRASALKQCKTWTQLSEIMDRLDHLEQGHDNLEHLRQTDEQTIKALKEENERLKEENRSLRAENEDLKEASKSPK